VESEQPLMCVMFLSRPRDREDSEIILRVIQKINYITKFDND
jgi:hypothetical protein